MSRSRMKLVARAAALSCLLAVGVAGCGGSDSSAAGADTKASPSPPAPSGSVTTEAPEPDNEPTVGPKKDQSDVMTRLPGKKKQGCVEVGRGRDVRSGSMAAGPFDTAASTGAKVRLYFIPSKGKKLEPLTVNFLNKATGAQFVRQQKQISDVNEINFYDLTVAIPDPGTWTVRATNGAESGCWVAKLG